MSDEISVVYDLGEVIAGTVDDIVAKLPALTVAELDELHEREEAGKNRSTLLDAIHRETKAREAEADTRPDVVSGFVDFPADAEPVEDGWWVELIGDDEQPVDVDPIAVGDDPLMTGGAGKLMQRVEIPAHFGRMTIVGALLRFGDGPWLSRADLVLPVTAGAGQGVTFAPGTFAFTPIA